MTGLTGSEKKTVIVKLQGRWSSQRILTIGGSITVQLTSCLTGLDLTKQVKLELIQFKPNTNKINRRSAVQ